MDPEAWAASTATTNTARKEPCSLGDKAKVNKKEVFDEKEFGEASESMTCDENSINPAAKLGLFDEAVKDNRFLFELPALVPMLKQVANVEGSLSAGFLGKMLVYKSGAIKMKLGETIYDVSPGT